MLGLVKILGVIAISSGIATIAFLLFGGSGEGQFGFWALSAAMSLLAGALLLCFARIVELLGAILEIQAKQLSVLEARR